MQSDTTAPNASASTETLIIDEVELERLERDLADAADTLEAVERICAAGVAGADTAVAIRQLLEDGRFVLPQPDSEPAIEPERLAATSDLVGNGDVDSAQQVDAVAQRPTPGV